MSSTASAWQPFPSSLAWDWEAPLDPCRMDPCHQDLFHWDPYHMVMLQVQGMLQVVQPLLLLMALPLNLQVQLLSHAHSGRDQHFAT